MAHYHCQERTLVKHQNTLEGDVKGVTDNVQSLNVAPTLTSLLFEPSASPSGRQFVALANAPDASYQTLSSYL